MGLEALSQPGFLLAEWAVEESGQTPPAIMFVITTKGTGSAGREVQTMVACMKIPAVKTPSRMYG